MGKLRWVTDGGGEIQLRAPKKSELAAVWPWRATYAVDYMYVPPRLRGQGHAGALMDAVGQWADKNCETLALYVAPYGPRGGRLSCEALEQFYERRGFLSLPNPPGASLYMVRAWRAKG